MSPDPAPTRHKEPRFNPLWWWVIGAFVVLITAWTTIIFIARTHPVEEIDLSPPEETEPSAGTEAAPEE